MAVPNRTGVPDKTSQTEQYVLNYSFDEVFKILMVGLAGYNASTNSMDRLQIDGAGGIKVSDAATTSRYDLQAPIYYIGSAPVGTAESTAAWTITKYDLTSNPYSATIATATSWTGRASGSYS